METERKKKKLLRKFSLLVKETQLQIWLFSSPDTLSKCNSCLTSLLFGVQEVSSALMSNPLPSGFPSAPPV